jgi:hypothetical protein
MDLIFERINNVGPRQSSPHIGEHSASTKGERFSGHTCVEIN